MTRFYFDHHSSSEKTVDDVGTDLVDENTARNLALEAVGQLIIDGAHRGQTGQVTVEVRSAAGSIFRAIASVELEPRG